LFPKNLFGFAWLRVAFLLLDRLLFQLPAAPTEWAQSLPYSLTLTFPTFRSPQDSPLSQAFFATLQGRLSYFGSSQGLEQSLRSCPPLCSNIRLLCVFVLVGYLTKRVSSEESKGPRPVTERPYLEALEDFPCRC